MKKQIKTSINIKASKETVWNILMDFEQYPAWNPFIKKITGEPLVGSKLAIKLPGMSFTPKVLVSNRNQEFKWLGHLLVKGLFDGEHRFQLTDNGDGTTLFEHSEKFNGLLVGMFAKSLDKDTTEGFITMNKALKKRAEGVD